MGRGPIVTMAWEGMDVIMQARQMVGTTNRLNSNPGRRVFEGAKVRRFFNFKVFCSSQYRWWDLRFLVFRRKLSGIGCAIIYFFEKCQLFLSGAIRGDFSMHMGGDVVHGSDCPYSAKREIGSLFEEWRVGWLDLSWFQLCLWVKINLPTMGSISICGWCLILLSLTISAFTVSVITDGMFWESVLNCFVSRAPLCCVHVVERKWIRCLCWTWLPLGVCLFMFVLQLVELYKNFFLYVTLKHFDRLFSCRVQEKWSRSDFAERQSKILQTFRMNYGLSINWIFKMFCSLACSPSSECFWVQITMVSTRVFRLHVKCTLLKRADLCLRRV